MRQTQDMRHKLSCHEIPQDDMPWDTSCETLCKRLLSSIVKFVFPDMCIHSMLNFAELALWSLTAVAAVIIALSNYALSLLVNHCCTFG